MLKTWKWLFPLFVMGLFPVFAQADSVLGTETAGGGFVGTIPGTATVVGSDGEAAFNPFGFAGGDTSDGIDLSKQFGFVYDGAPGWVQTSPGVYVLPADLTGVGCGFENEPTCEPVGHWTSPDPWVSSVLGSYDILEAGPGGAVVSDIITLADVGGNATVTFQSDPFPVPEPSSLALVGTGLLFGAWTFRSRVSKKA